jgi:6-pyruvoyltetrahydropterin/6-carboxytetrahydropterin synthase
MAHSECVCKVFRFEAAHRLLKHNGKCSSTHGHSYRAEVHVTGPVNADGMVIDFADLKDGIGEWIKTNLDHNYILNPADPLLALGEGSVHRICGRPPFVMTSDHPEPTAENIARLIFGMSSKTHNTNEMRVILVKVWETETCAGIYFPRN